MNSNRPKRSDQKASYTAMAAAYLRAAHLLLDAPPWILEDPLALPLLGEGSAKRILDSVERYQSAGAKTLRSHIVLRSRFTEDCLQAAGRRGVAQYVVLGAGLDTFSLRQPLWAGSLKIYEVDQPASQEEKRRRIREAGIEVPENVCFLSIDFEREALPDCLRKASLSMDQPTFFSWLGVTMYLNEEAVYETLRSIAAFPAGSEIVFTFLQPPELLSEKKNAPPVSLARKVAEVDEPFICYLEPKELGEKLISLGFTEVAFLSPVEAGDRYFKARPEDLPAPQRTGIVRAVK
jgi:methyltransferase (TIGR00027 family)